jgi:hypothetical protein
MSPRLELPDAPSPGPITPFAIREVTIWCAAIACIVLPLAGELFRALAFLQFLVVPCLALALGITVLARCWRTPRLVGALVLVALGVYLWARLTGGVPLYVHRAAEPIITALRHYHDMHGTYPPGGGHRDVDTPAELDALITSTRCHYRTDEDGFRVTCMGVMFNHCTYDSAENRWIVWD